MRSLQDEIRRVQKELVCPICSQRFGLRDIKVIFSGHNKAEASAVCSKGHFPVILVLPIRVNDIEATTKITKKDLGEYVKQITNLKEKIINAKD